MRAFILCDYEGTTGTVCWEEQDRLGPEAMAGDVNAVIAGLRDGGFIRFVVRDYHGGGRTINPADIDPAATLIRGRSTPFPFGLGPNYDAMVFAGAHARAGTAAGVMSHTMTDHVSDLRINGTSIGEIGGFALLAGCYDLPLILVTGDDAACQEAKELLPDVKTVSVKTGLSRQCAACLHPSVARDLIRRHAEAAARRVGKIRPLKWEGPFTLDITFNVPENADKAAVTTGGQRFDDRTVRLVRDTIPELLACFERGFE
ncbi:MAG: M55 family metallopeptidase [Armatimonadota bacterium]